MIRRLVLENWRNYESADVHLSSGTTFVVASNGVGKTSFVEAARWALFGSELATVPARVGTGRTSATVELTLPDSTVLTATRVWDDRKTKPVHQLTLTRDGVGLRLEAWEDLCVQLFGCSTNILERLTMPTNGPARTSNLGLHEHLCAVYGVDHLSEASDRLVAAARDVAREVSAIKGANAVKAEELETMRADVDSAAERLDAAMVAVQGAERQVELARQRDDQRDRAVTRAREAAQIDEARGELLRRVSDLLGAPVSAADVVEVLDQRTQDARSNVDAIRLELRLVERRQQDIERDLAGLDAATDDCPTCRRPLDDDAREHAHAIWRIELSELAERAAAARQDEPAAAARVAALEGAQSQLAALAQRAAALAPLAEDQGIDAPPTESAMQAFRSSAEAEALAKDSHQRAQARLNEAIAADEDLRKLERLFAREGRLEMARNATESTREEILGTIVQPLAEEINVRWSSLFPNRGTVSTRADGTMSRSVGEHDLTFDAFSTAESTAALIIMRLLVVAMTTRATFVWFDEPLEHLDPDVRRNVASLLSRVTGEGSLEQVVVTTYEETLARKLQERSPSRTRLVDVR